MKKIKVLIADDHPLIQDGMRSMMKSNRAHYHFIIEQARTTEIAIEKFKKINYDVVFMDYQIPRINGAEATRIMCALKPNAAIIALSAYNDVDIIKQFQQAGAKGYLLKNMESGELFKAITTVLEGEEYYSNEVATNLMNYKKNAPKIPYEKKLSQRESETLNLISQGYTSKKIAKKLFISKHTVDKCRQSLLKKIGVNNTVDLLLRSKILKPS